MQSVGTSLTPDSQVELHFEEPFTWRQFFARFPDEHSCRQYLARLRWPAGFHCSNCGSEKGWRLSDGLWSCSGCARKVSVTAGTVFDRSRVPLTNWFAAAWLMAIRSHGVSALALQGRLGLGSYQTAWTMLRKLRWAMAQSGQSKLQGVVEVGKAFLAGRQTIKKGRDEEDEHFVAIAAEAHFLQGVGMVRLKRIDDLSSRSLGSFVERVVEGGSEVRTIPGVDHLEMDSGHEHRVVFPFDNGFREQIALPGIRFVAVQLKRWLAKTPKGSINAQLLDLYLDEFTLRFNCRGPRSNERLFSAILEACVHSTPSRFRPTRARPLLRKSC
jgi:ribosomal protein L37AE/L43A